MGGRIKNKMESKSIDMWDKMVEDASDGFKEYFEEEEKFLRDNINQSDEVLDLGCGTGRTLMVISPISKSVVGIDNDKNAVRSAKRNTNGLTNTKILLEDAEETSFKDNTFDVIFIGLTFVNFAETKTKILNEIKRILKKMGD
jgi:ubiquinone/menaquinone biosynthesis C-methylase UbiE